MNTISISDAVHYCFDELFNECNSKVNDCYEAIGEMISYLTSNVNKKYDYVLNNYPVDKDLILKMVYSNFMEITYYRSYLGIKLDNDRKFFLEKAKEVINSNVEHFMDLLYCTSGQLALMISDVLLYFNHYSPIYSYNAVMSFKNTEFANYLYEIYPLAKMEHNLTIESSQFKGTEYLLYTLYEIIINETERLEIGYGIDPIVEDDYVVNLNELVKYYNGSKDENGNDKDYNLHKVINKEFRKRIDVDNNPEYKELLVELCVKMITIKEILKISLNEIENNLLTYFDNNKIVSFEGFYDGNNQLIMSILLDNIFYIDRELLLSDISNIEDLKLELK